MFMHASREMQWERSQCSEQFSNAAYEDSLLSAAVEAHFQLDRAGLPSSAMPEEQERIGFEFDPQSAPFSLQPPTTQLPVEAFARSPWAPSPDDFVMPSTPASPAISLLDALTMSPQPSRSPISLSQALTPSAESPARVLRLASELTPSPAMQSLGSGHRFPPGLDPPPGTPSHGSTLHAVGDCRPCAWFWKAAGCQNGQDCTYCHICPADEAKQRRKARANMARMEARLDRDHGPCRTLSFHSDSPSCSERFGQVSDHESTVGPDTENEFTAGSDQEEDKEQGRRQKLASSSSAPSSPSLASSAAGPTMHGVGMCQPCAWFWKPTGCQRGTECTFCHLCPEGELKARKASKHTMMRMGRSTSSHFAQAQPAPQMPGGDRCLLSLSSLV